MTQFEGNERIYVAYDATLSSEAAKSLGNVNFFFGSTKIATRSHQTKPTRKIQNAKKRILKIKASL